MAKEARQPGRHLAIQLTQTGHQNLPSSFKKSSIRSLLPSKEDLRLEYEKWFKLPEIFPINGVGVITERDSIVIDFHKKDLINKIAEFASPSITDDVLRLKYIGNKKGKYPPGDTCDWKLSDARKKLQSEQNISECIQPLLYRPFDLRPLFYANYMEDWSRYAVMQHLLSGENIGLCSNKETLDDFSHVFCSRNLINACTIFEKTKKKTYFFPLYLYPKECEKQLEKQRQHNLNPKIIKLISEKLGLKFIADGKGESQSTLGPEDIFNYAYAIFNSHTYNSRYWEYLKIDYPRLPLTSDKSLFELLVKKGEALVALHLMESTELNTPITKYEGSGEHEVDKIRYVTKNQRVYINDAQYFEGVSPEVWNFHIGGFQVCKNWLKDHGGRRLSIDDIKHYHKIIVVLNGTIRLVKEIDKLIEGQGGWPQCFK